MAVSCSESSVSTLPVVRRVSWGAIFVGLVITIVLQVLLGIPDLAQAAWWTFFTLLLGAIAAAAGANVGANRVTVVREDIKADTHETMS